MDMDKECDDPRPSEPPPVRKVLGRVHIYGGGITGLTAAHELARRGFRVRIYEYAEEYDEKGHLEGHPHGQRLAVGGIARTQFRRVEKGACGNFPGDGRLTTCAEYTYFFESPKKFDTVEDCIAALQKDEALTGFMIKCGLCYNIRTPGIIYIRLPLLADSDGSKYLWDNAHALHRFLTTPRYWTENAWIPEPSRVIVMSRGQEQLAKDLGDPLPLVPEKAGIHLQVLHFLPGEHGFRFFPSYYRHLFSTMVETPLLDAQNKPTGHRVFDNLVPSSFYGIAAQGRRIRFLRRTPSTRPADLMQDLQDLTSSGYPPSDMLQFTLRIWRYMCTCSERRKKEYEKISWQEYLEGYEPETKKRRYQYSRDFVRDMQFAPRVLAAFDGAWGDARTNGNTFVQLYLNNLLPQPKTDGTLNGPTTPAWFSPWRRYLEDHLRVEFVRGKLLTLELREGRIVPIVQWLLKPATSTTTREDVTSEGPLGTDVDYYIVATDAVAAEEVTAKLPRIGVIEKLQGFTKTIPPNPRGKEPEQQRANDAFPGRVPWDRFQTLTGIQFFFPSSVRLAEGYLYFLDAPWGLSAINSQQYWATPPTFEEDGFGAVLSVDIGNWYVREGPSPSNCSRHEIAQEVWRQIKTATQEHNAPLPHASKVGFGLADSSALPDPAWYSMDRFITFKTDPTSQKERPTQNLAPYLIPIVGDWKNRPGPEPWDPLDFRSEEKKPAADLPKDLWQAPHGGYPVHWDRLVFAGTYLKTFTRMTTMESANESARHAVNAIMDHYLVHRYEKDEKPHEATRGATPYVRDYGGGSLTGSPDFRMTPIGEYCRIWNPEEHELAELVPIRELDAKLFAAGLPHLWDLLHLEPLVTALIPPHDPMGGTKALLEFLRTLRESPLAGMGFASRGGTGNGGPGSP